MTSRIEKQEVSLAEAMHLTKYTKQNLQKLIDAGHVRRKERATFELGNLFAGVMAHLRLERKTKAHSAAQERLIAARAEEVEMRNKVRSGELMPTKEHNEIFNEVFGVLKSNFMSLPSMILAIDTRYRSDRDLRQRAEQMTHNILNKCVDDFKRLSDEQLDEQAGRSTPQPTNDEEDD
jgi:hypothetical protein